MTIAIQNALVPPMTPEFLSVLVMSHSKDLPSMTVLCANSTTVLPLLAQLESSISLLASAFALVDAIF
jgi:hypothetical protein